MTVIKVRIGYLLEFISIQFNYIALEPAKSSSSSLWLAELVFWPAILHLIIPRSLFSFHRCLFITYRRDLYFLTIFIDLESEHWEALLLEWLIRNNNQILLVVIGDGVKVVSRNGARASGPFTCSYRGPLIAEKRSQQKAADYRLRIVVVAATASQPPSSSNTRFVLVKS